MFKTFSFRAMRAMRLGAGIVVLGMSTTVSAVTEPDTVYLKQDCGTESDCYTTVNSMLTAIWGRTTLPSSTSPLLVSMGPGRFAVDKSTLFCDGSTETRGFVTFKGAGKGATVLERDTSHPSAVMHIKNCDSMTFQDFTIDGRSINSGVSWTEGGDSVWTNIDIINAGTYAWLDSCPVTDEASEHYWYSSKLIGTGSASTGDTYRFTYRTQCAINWFYGGDLVAIDDGETGVATTVFANGSKGDMRIFGSTVRAIRTANSEGATYPNNLIQAHTAFVVDGGGTIHMHGGIVAAQSFNENENHSPVAITISTGGGMVHTPDTAFDVRATGTGEAIRVYSGTASTVMSPFQWPAGTTPPEITSLSGLDTFIETDCNSSGVCNSSGTETHMMIYNNDCSTDGTWFNSTTGRCRGVTP